MVIKIKIKGIIVVMCVRKDDFFDRKVFVFFERKTSKGFE